MNSNAKKMSASRRAYHVFFTLAVTGAGCMFTYKLFMFMKTIKKDELAGFAFDPLIIYAFVAMGFIFLLAWAYMTGQFRDIESPKFEMLEKFDELEKQERAQRRLAGGQHE